MSLLRKRNAIIFLLGAGASYDADIPISGVMIDRLEELVSDESDRDFYEHHDLYYYIKSAINYGNEIKKIKKQPQTESVYNIESLVMSLEELAKKDEHHLYPFIGAWNPKLTELTDKDFQNIKEFRDKIVDKVRDWVELKRKELADYYQGLINFQKDYEHPLRIFSLNYDLCVETACDRLIREYPERGFYPRRYADESLARTWNWQLLDESVIENESKTILLYKLHGSVDWKRHEGGKLTFEDGIHDIDSKHRAVIFGTAYKLQYYDPFLYLFQEFRKWSLQAKLIVCIGYGFFDEHINSILGQALNSDPEMKLLWVAPVWGDDADERDKNRKAEVAKIEESLRLNEANGTKVIRLDLTARDFMLGHLEVDKLAVYFPQDEDLLPEIKLDDVDKCQYCQASLVGVGSANNEDEHARVIVKQYECGYSEVNGTPKSGCPHAAQPAQEQPEPSIVSKAESQSL